MSTEEGKTSTETNVAPEFGFFLEDAIIEPDNVNEEPTQVKEPVTNTTEKDDAIIDDTSPVVDTDKEDVKEDTVDTSGDETEETIPEGADPKAYGIYKTLVDHGYTQERKDFKGTYEEIDQIFETLPSEILKSVYDEMPEPLQYLFRYGLAEKQKGNDVSWSVLNQFVKENSPVDYESIDISDVTKQRDFLVKEYLNEGYDNEVAQTFVDSLEDKGELENTAKKKLESKKDSFNTKAKTTVTETEAEVAAREQAKREFQSKIKEEISKTGWKPVRQTAVQQELMQGNIPVKSREVMKHPAAIVQLADFFTYFDAKKGVFDLEAYAKHGASPKTQEIKNRIERNFKESPGTGGKEVVQPKKLDTSNFEFGDV